MASLYPSQLLKALLQRESLRSVFDVDVGCNVVEKLEMARILSGPFMDHFDLVTAVDIGRLLGYVKVTTCTLGPYTF